MTFPDRINSGWIDSLRDDQLQRAERDLRKEFKREERSERVRQGDRYDLMRGPEVLMRAWNRWSMVNNAHRCRGLRLLESR